MGEFRKAGKAGLKLDAENLSLPPDGTAGGFDIAGLLSTELREAFLEPGTLATKTEVPEGPKIASTVTAV